MSVDHIVQNDVLLVSLEGRMDTDAAVTFETELSSQCKENAPLNEKNVHPVDIRKLILLSTIPTAVLTASGSRV